MVPVVVPLLSTQD